MKKITGFAVVGLCLAVAAYGSTNVFNDAVFWFRGGKDCVTANNQLQTGEFFDDLHADDANHANHKMTVYGYPENATFRTEPVVFPALGKSVEKQMQVLHIEDNRHETSDPAVTNRKPMIVYSHDIFARNNISNEYTIVCRIKLDMLSRTEWLLRVGYDGGNKQGLLLGFKESTIYSGCKQVTGYLTPNSNSSLSSFNLNTMVVPTNTWADMAVVVGNGKARIGVAVPESLSIHNNNSTIVFTDQALWTENCPLLTSGKYRLFGESESQEGPSAKTTGFIGSVQQIAIWGRMLSDREVMEAFGMPRPAIFRTGFDNGASNEFGGTRTGASQAIEGLGSWQGITDTMLAGDTWTVSFDALRDEAGLPQIFSIRSLPNSSTARFNVTLNGTSIGTRRVSRNARVFWPVAANLIVSGANTLTLQRTDDGIDVFRMDAMELGGSFGVGIENQSSSNDGKTYPKRMYTSVPSLANPNPQHWPQNLQTYDGISNVHFRVWMDPDAKTLSTARLRMRIRCTNRSNVAPYLILGNETFSLLVNGVEKSTVDSSTSWTGHTIDFVSGVLHEGWNDVELKSAPWGTCFWMIDYYRFETSLSRGFSIPPPGFGINFR